MTAFRDNSNWYLKLITITKLIPSVTYAPGFNQYAEGKFMKAAAVSNGYTDVYALVSGKFYVYSGDRGYSVVRANAGDRIIHAGNYSLLTVVYTGK